MIRKKIYLTNRLFLFSLIIFLEINGFQFHFKIHDYLKISGFYDKQNI